MVGACKRKLVLGRHVHLMYCILQGCLQHHGSGYGMPHLIRCQQMSILLEHLGLQHLHIAYSLIHLIGQCCQHQREHRVGLQTFQEIIHVALPPDIDGFTH